MKRLLKGVFIILIWGLIVSEFGVVFCENKNDPKPFSWNFKDTDLIKVIEAVAEYTGKNFNIDPTIKGKVNLVTETPISPDLAYQILESILLSRGYALVPVVDGNLINVVPTKDAISAAIPTEVGKVPEEIQPYENLVTQIVPVEFAQAAELASVLQSLKSEFGRIDAYVPANLLIITETASQVRRLVQIVEKIDVQGLEEEWEIIRLEYQSAETLAQKILEVLSEEAAALAAGQRVQPTVPPTPRRVMPRGAPQAPAIIGAARTPLRIVADEWSNSLIVVGVKSMVEKAKKLIARLDVPTPFEQGNVHLYMVENADCKEIADALDSLISGAGPQAGKAAAPGMVQAFAKEVRISPYEPANALFITACPQDWTVLEKLLKEIDVPEAQVYVEAVIMEVTINDDVTVGVDLTAIGEEDFVAASTFGNLANFIVQGPLGYTGGLAGVLRSDIEITVPGIDPVTGEPTGTTITVPRVPVLLTAIQTVTDVDVLSAPALLAIDNQEAMIHVGKNVPVISGTARPLAQEATIPTVFSSVNREQVGVMLTVEPQISQGGAYVKLKVQVEVSDTIKSEIELDPNIAGPTFSQTQIENTVIIRDGYMGIIGGLMKQKTDVSRSQVPILGDIPILGFFFRQKARSQAKSNLVVILTPYIVRSEEELDELTTRHREQFDLDKQEMREGVNFWRRVFKKQKRTTRT